MTTVIITRGPHALSNHAQINLSEISPCNHEEADTRIFLHIKDAVKGGYRTVMIRANDRYSCDCCRHFLSITGTGTSGNVASFTARIESEVDLDA